MICKTESVNNVLCRAIGQSLFLSQNISLFNQNIDFKYLRQRIGYAYFMKANYFESQKQYEKALMFDENDINTLLYLYYCGLNIGNRAYTRFREGLLPNNLKNNFKIKPVKVVSVVDVEYNYKANNSESRGNPTYIRGGVESDIGYRLNLYQSFSNYSQVNDSSIIKQKEYFALLGWAVSSHLVFNVGYHYINSDVTNSYSYNTYIPGPHNSLITLRTTDTISTAYSGNLFMTRLSYTLNRFDFSVSGSVMKYNSVYTQQYGIHAGVTLPGKANVYLKSSLYGMFDSNMNNRLIFSQSAGTLFFKNLWLEGNAVFGNQDNFADNNGLYVYNSLDPTTFKAGISLFWYLPKNITLYTNYTFDNKYIIAEGLDYAQNSFTGGIIWKL